MAAPSPAGPPPTMARSYIRLRLEGEAELARQFLVFGIDENRAIREDHRRDGPSALLDLLDPPQPCRVLVDVDPVIADALLGEESLGAPAVWTPRGAEHSDVGHGTDGDMTGRAA